MLTKGGLEKDPPSMCEKQVSLRLKPNDQDGYGGQGGRQKKWHPVITS